MLGSFFFSLALRKFRKSSGKEIDISQIVSYFLKQGKNGNGYQYKASILYGKKPRDVEVFYFDAPYRIILYCSKETDLIPIACLSFCESRSSRAIRIEQIQGPSYAESEDQSLIISALAEIKWERLMVQIVCEWAKANGVKSVELISCKKSHWYRELRHQQMFMRYDVTARRMGFYPSKEENVYEINIKKLRSVGEAAI